MSQGFKWILHIGSLFGLIQSVVWMSFGIVGALTYLCVIPVAPYKDENDFFRVTLVKFYFEGPNCIPDGSYLGEFNEIYKKLPLFSPDLVFATMIAYLIISTLYCIFSIGLYYNRNNPEKRMLVLFWSSLTLLQCAIDVVLSYKFILDIFTLRPNMENMGSKPSWEIGEMTSSARYISGDFSYISMVLALTSIRFIVVWVWNFLTGFVLFFDALCFRNIVGVSLQPDKKVERPKRVVEEPQKSETVVEEPQKSKTVVEEPQKSETVVEEPQNPVQVPCIPVSLICSKNTYNIRSNPDYLDFKKSMEAVTKFSNDSDNESSHLKTTNRIWGQHPSEDYLHHSKPQTSKDWEMTNKGYVSDEPDFLEPEKNLDFDHNLKNFESVQRKIKIMKPPIGKPVSIPNPPPLLTSDSYNC